MEERELGDEADIFRAAAAGQGAPRDNIGIGNLGAASSGRESLPQVEPEEGLPDSRSAELGAALARFRDEDAGLLRRLAE